MAVNITANRDNFASAINGVLAQYGTQIRREMDEIVPDVGKNCAKKIRQKAPKRQDPARRPEGHEPYSKTWKTSTTRDANVTVTTVYSKYPGMPHLLEKSHKTRLGTSKRPGYKPKSGAAAESTAIAHIAPAANEAARELQKKLEQIIK